MPLWAQLAWPLLIAVIVFLLPRLRTTAQSATDVRLRIVEDGSWTRDERLTLERRLAQLETLIGAVQKTQAEYLNMLERLLSDAARSPHTPELDILLDKRRTGEEWTPREYGEVVRRLDEAYQIEVSPGKKSIYASLRAVAISNYRRKIRERLIEAWP